MRPFLPAVKRVSLYFLARPVEDKETQTILTSSSLPSPRLATSKHLRQTCKRANGTRAAPPPRPCSRTRVQARAQPPLPPLVESPDGSRRALLPEAGTPKMRGHRQPDLTDKASRM